jgi:TorA maturation chaperone TorD
VSALADGVRADLAPEEQARADAYRLLGLLLAGPPNAELLGLLQAIEPGGGPMAEPWEALRLAAATADPRRLRDEYQALFIGLGRGELNPYASWYLTGFLMEKPLADLRRELVQLGYGRREEVAEPEDHIAALCELMSLLIGERRMGFGDLQRFFERYMGAWAGRFFADLEQAQSADFYRAVGRLGSTFLGVEKQYFSMPV